jgi:hypothetical protein
MKQPAPKDWMQLAATIDWPRQLQRAGVLLRRLRGDDVESIQSDHETELQRGEGLQRLITRSMRTAVGCVAPKPCACTYCTEGPPSV